MKNVKRRAWKRLRAVPFALCAALCLALFLSACGAANGPSVAQGPLDAPDPPAVPAPLVPLPAPEPDGGPFGIDVNINMGTIDDYLGRPDVAYIDMRMLFDPADFESIGGISTLTRTLPGYRIVPLPYLATLSAMPVSGAYDGPRLFEVLWGDDGGILSLSPNYLESGIILDELFPKDKPIFLMCGGAGYSALTRALLIHMGWDPNLIYSTGGNWYYEGDQALPLTIPHDGADGGLIHATWRANYAFIDFEHLHRLAP